MNNVGLVLEGGGLRGVYTAGVLDFFMDRELYFPYVIGVSAGVCNATSYLSRQLGRNKRVNINYVNDPRYLSYRNFIKERSIFGIDFIYNKLPNDLEPFDYDTFFSSKEKFLIGVTDCTTGKPVYIDKEEFKTKEEFLTIVRASSSLPFLSPMVKYKELQFLDGGIADPIPIKKSISDGNLKNIIVLTRNSGYIKEPFNMKWLAGRVYSNHKNLIEAMIERHNVYNETIKQIDSLEQNSEAIVIRPSEKVVVDRLEKDSKKLINLYELGYSDAKAALNKIEELIKAKEATINLDTEGVV